MTYQYCETSPIKFELRDGAVECTLSPQAAVLFNQVSLNRLPSAPRPSRCPRSWDRSQNITLAVETYLIKKGTERQPSLETNIKVSRGVFVSRLRNLMRGTFLTSALPPTLR
ncbi:hypothetical protein JZ751_014197 [Albula glossodonta]|uniref:Uncharacterized protein n=1 Tax=Albula glossodonta TaxID=121402 RepID=A0A8T2P0Q1_9TELE|nr:hypothetical protein JZ751_014197 [Albula glossodonta]